MFGYKFRNPALLQQALTHRSHGPVHNERLEFVGDGILNCVIGALLFNRNLNASEGELSRMRARLVNAETLAEIARKHDVGNMLQLGAGEVRSGGRSRPSILADAMEAIFGAVLMDGGLDEARKVIVAAYAEHLNAKTDAGADSKTRLQEYLQARHLPLPTYMVVGVSGAAHSQSFTVRAEACNQVAHGTASTRKAAEQAAAEGVLTLLSLL